VKIVKEDVSPQVKLDYRTLDNCVKQLIIKLPMLNAGETPSARHLRGHQARHSRAEDPTQFVRAAEAAARDPAFPGEESAH